MKRVFSSGLPAIACTVSKMAKREMGIWQRRFGEHQIRDEVDLQRHVDYIHINPVKHGYVKRVSDWLLSSFHNFVERGLLPADWAGVSDGEDAHDFSERVL